MHEGIVVEPMTERFILWRCLHGGPLSPETIEQWPTDDQMPWQAFRSRNVPLLERLIAAYGTCALLARDGDQVVGSIRFYPKEIASWPEAGELCLQQDFPAGPSESLAERGFPPLEEIEDRTLLVHCMMTGYPSRESPYQRKGIGTRLVRELVAWAREAGWQAIEAKAYEDLPIIYAITGAAGKSFWEKLRFSLVRTAIQPYFEQESEFVKTMREQAIARGTDLALIKNEYTMRLELA